MTAGKLAAIIVVLGAVGAAIAIFSGEGEERTAPAVEPTKVDGLVPEERRKEYVEKFIKVHDLAVDPDQKPGETGEGSEVRGLLRVHGTVENLGEEKVDLINLAIHMKDGSGEVVASYVEDIAQKRVLAPGERRAFKFTVPDKPEFTREFAHSLR